MLSPPTRPTFFANPGTLIFSSRRRSPSCALQRLRPAVPGLERRLLDGRRALHAGHRAQRVCTHPSRLSLPNSGHRYLDHRARQRPNRASIPARSSRRSPVRFSGRYFLRSRDPDSGRVRVVPELRRLVEFRRLNFMDADYGVARESRRDLLPQRDHLLRPAHTGANPAQAGPCNWRRADTCSLAMPRPCTI